MVKIIENERLYRDLAEKGFGQGGVARAALDRGLERRDVILLLHRVFTMPALAAREVVNRVQTEAGNTPATYLPYWEIVHFGPGGRPRLNQPETEAPSLN